MAKLCCWSPAPIQEALGSETKQKHAQQHGETLCKVWCEKSNANGRAVDAKSVGTNCHHLGFRDKGYRVLKSSNNNGGFSSNSLSLFLCLLDPRHLPGNPIQKMKEDSVVDILTPTK